MAEPHRQAGAIDLQFLFLVMTFREQIEVVPRGEVLERFGNTLHNLERLFENPNGEPIYALEIAVQNVALAEPLVALLQVPPEIHRAIAVDAAVHALDLIEHGP